MEWGGKAYDLMWRLKSLFDPDDVLNPGVVLNKVPFDLCSEFVSAVSDVIKQQPSMHRKSSIVYGYSCSTLKAGF